MKKCRYCDKDAIVQQNITGVDSAIQEHVCSTHAYNANDRMLELERQVARQYGIDPADKVKLDPDLLKPNKQIPPGPDAEYHKKMDGLLDRLEKAETFVKPVDVTLGTPTAGKAPPEYVYAKGTTVEKTVKHFDRLEDALKHDGPWACSMPADRVIHGGYKTPR